MSIVKGNSGQLSASASLITNAAHAMFVWFKPSSISGVFANIISYHNTTEASTQFSLQMRDGPIRYNAVQGGFSAAPGTPSPAVINTWTPLLGLSTSARISSIHSSIGTATSGGSYDVINAEASPELIVFSGRGELAVPDGSKVGGIAIYAATLDQADIDHLLGGGALDDLPSETAPVEYWLDSAGLVKDGSNNLTTWTGQISGTVLTPSGTVTVDDADIAPISGVVAPTITPGLPATMINQPDGSTPLASTQVAVTVTNAVDAVLYDATPTTDASGILAALDLSAHASEPAVGDVVTYTLVYNDITYQFSRTLEDIGA